MTTGSSSCQVGRRTPGSPPRCTSGDGPCTTSGPCRTSASPVPARRGRMGRATTNGSRSTAVAAVELVRGGWGAGPLRRTATRSFRGRARPGCLGVVTRLWLRTEPAYEVSQVVHTGVPSGPLLERLDEVLAMGYSVSVFSTFSESARVDGVWLNAPRGAWRRPGACLCSGVPPDTVPRHPVPGHGPGGDDGAAGRARSVAPPAAPLPT